MPERRAEIVEKEIMLGAGSLQERISYSLSDRLWKQLPPALLRDRAQVADAVSGRQRSLSPDTAGDRQV